MKKKEIERKRSQLAENLEVIQNACRMTMDEFGEKIMHKGRGVFANYVYGVSDPSIESVRLVSDACKITIDDLVRRPINWDEMPPHPFGPKPAIQSVETGMVNEHATDYQPVTEGFGLEKTVLSLMDRCQAFEKRINELENKIR